MNYNIVENLWTSIHEQCDPSLLCRTRIHKLPLFERFRADIYIKREDESGFTTSGYKKRKYASILPFIKKHNVENVVLIGGAHSNHIPAITPLLKSQYINVHAFIKTPHNPHLLGNLLLTRLLLSDEEITWVPSHQWRDSMNIAQAYSRKMAGHTCLIPEGGSFQPALPGVLTLYEDIIYNETEIGLEFNHILIDAGTGYTAAAIVLANSILKRKSKIHIVLMASTSEEFQDVLNQVCKDCSELLGITTEILPSSYILYHPFTAASFGSVNQSVLKACIKYSRSMGILTDPIYTTKLLMNAEQIIRSDQISGNVLIVHSGGGTGLMGFSQAFEKILT